ncbi:MAG: hypothetical protein E7406_08920 [Ruminococcaceae bacterium]|nr:hypothetical protein [Oscillospiraceae bacterium]
MENDKEKELCAKDSELNTEQDHGVPFWTACGWNTVPSNSRAKHVESKCPYSNDIRYSIIDNSIAEFYGSGALRGRSSFEPDEPDSTVGIRYYCNCFGEGIANFVDWGSTYYTILGDIYNPNEWCVEVVVGDRITVIEKYAFYGLSAVRRVTIKGKNTVIANGEIPNNVIICAPSDSVAKLYAQRNGNPFEELKKHL